jgi:N-acetylglucosaminyl-diphospho-decaprenol L-rhamnosyltransferase
VNDLAVVLVTYNCADWVGRCLDALPAALAGRSAEVVVVDNASADESVAAVLRHPEAELLVNERNVGFAAAVNQGVRASDAPWVLLLNPDTDPRPGSLDALLTFAEANPTHLIYGGRTLREDGAVEPSSCWGLPSVWSTICFALGLNTVFPRSRVFDPESLGRWPRDTVREVGMVTGCLLLIPRSTWEALGGLDEQFFVYGEDADLSARARALGARPIITPAAEIVHAVGVSASSSKLPLLLAGKITYARRHFPGAQAQLVVTLLRTGAGVRALGSRALRRETIWTAAWQHRRAWWDGFPARA